LRRYEIILDDAVVGVWSGESRAAALDACAKAQGYEDSQSAAMRDWKDKKITVIAVGSRPVIIEDEPHT
jgi:hypothetical protein